MSTTPPITPRKWILVVDDDTHLREVWIDALRSAGYAAVGSPDALAAAELIRDLFPDLILLDLHMPRASGRDFLEIVRAHPHWQNIPILIVSGFLDEGVPIEEKGLKVVGRMAKPVPIDELLEKVREATVTGFSPGKDQPSATA